MNADAYGPPLPQLLQIYTCWDIKHTVLG